MTNLDNSCQPSVEKFNNYGTVVYRHSVTGQYHRDDGPAIIYQDGVRCWYQHGYRHRLDGPAIEWPDGTHEFWFEGHKFGAKTFQKAYDLYLTWKVLNS